MKKYFLLVCLSISFLSFSLGQTTYNVSANCTEIIISNFSNPNPATSAYSISGACGSGTCTMTCAAPIRVVNLWRLENVVTGQVFTYQGGSNQTFRNLPKGDYEVSVRTPQYESFPACPNDRRRVLNTLGQTIGWQGRNSFAEIPPSNGSLFTVGQPTSSNVSYTFNDGNDGLFDFGETVRINTSATNTYDRWWVAIFENSNPFRYKSNGWTLNSTVSEVNLTDIWGTNFTAGGDYTVQFAVANGNCLGPWANLDKDFEICLAGSGCRFELGSIEVRIGPNPAQDYFTLTLDNIDQNRTYNLSIHDLNGKEVKIFEAENNRKYELQGLSPGAYIINLKEDEQRIYSSKLMIQ